MQKESLNLRFGVIAAIVFVAAAARLLPHPSNVTPVGAMALFGGAYFGRKWSAYLIPLCALLLSDVVLNNVVYRAYFPTFTLFYSGALWQYLGFVAIVGLGWLLLKRVSILNVVLVSLLASGLFFLVSNFGVWSSGGMGYPKTGAGLMGCYVAGLPFFLNTLVGDLVWCGILFGGFEMAKQRFSRLSLTSSIS